MCVHVYDFIYLVIFGHTGSSLLRRLFCSFGQRWLLFVVVSLIVEHGL